MNQVSNGMDAKPVAYMEAGAYATFPRHSFVGLRECHCSGGVQSTARTGLVRSRHTVVRDYFQHPVEISRFRGLKLGDYLGPAVKSHARPYQTHDSLCCLTPLTVKRDRSQTGGLSRNHGSNTAVQPAKRSIKTHALTACYTVLSYTTEYY